MQELSEGLYRRLFHSTWVSPIEVWRGLVFVWRRESHPRARGPRFCSRLLRRMAGWQPPHTAAPPPVFLQKAFSCARSYYQKLFFPCTLENSSGCWCVFGGGKAVSIFYSLQSYSIKKKKRVRELLPGTSWLVRLKAGWCAATAGFFFASPPPSLRREPPPISLPEFFSFRRKGKARLGGTKQNSLSGKPLRVTSEPSAARRGMGATWKGLLERETFGFHAHTASCKKPLLAPLATWRGGDTSKGLLSALPPQSGASNTMPRPCSTCQRPASKVCRHCKCMQRTPPPAYFLPSFIVSWLISGELAKFPAS